MTGEDYEAAKPVPARSRVTGDPWQRDHLPECLDPASPEQCICSELRACEQRVREEEYSLPEGHPSRDLSYWEAGFSAGLAAARDAVAEQRQVPLAKTGYFLITRNTRLWDKRQEWTKYGWWQFRDSALAAIDALRDERNGSRNDGGG